MSGCGEDSAAEVGPGLIRLLRGDFEPAGHCAARGSRGSGTRVRDAVAGRGSGAPAVEGLAVLGLAAAPDPYAAGLALAVCGAGMGATMVLAPSLRQAVVPARLMGRVASTSRMLAMCAAPVGAFLGGWLATTYDIRTPLYAAAVLLLAMTAVTASMTSNRRVEAALRAAAPAGGPDHPATGEPARETAPSLS